MVNCNNDIHYAKRFVEIYRLVHIYMYVYVHVYYMWYSELGSAFTFSIAMFKVFRYQLRGVELEVYGCVEG